MNIQIENVKATAQKENFEIINICLNATRNTKTLKKAFLKLENELKNIVFWDFGRGGSHIWISNWKGERLILITE